VINEKKMMQTLKDPSVIGMKASWHDKNNYYFLFDYAINGDFAQFLKTHGKLIHHKIKSNIILVIFIELNRLD
jgi:serine/threonine protein kinase